MHTQNDSDYFKKAINSLKKYKEHINNGIADLVLHSSPLGIREEEIQADRIYSNSYASKRKRNEELNRAIYLYNKEQSEILSLLKAYKAERLQQAELDEKNIHRSREEKERLEAYELDAKQYLNTSNLDENKNFFELIKQLKLSILKCIENINNQIAQIQEFITTLNNDRQKQREEFLYQFYLSVKDILSRMYHIDKDHFEIYVESEKISVNLENAAKAVMNIVRKEFDSYSILDIEMFEYNVNQTFLKVISESIHRDAAPDRNLTQAMREIAVGFSTEVVKKEAETYSIAYGIDQLQTHRIQCLNDTVVVMKQKREALTQRLSTTNELSIEDISLEKLKDEINSVNESTEQITELQIDPNQETGLNNALETLLQYEKATLATPMTADELIAAPIPRPSG